MKRTMDEVSPNTKVDRAEKKMKPTFAGDPRLPPRIRQYLEDNRNKAAINVITMADDLQLRYSDYSRKKKNAFRKSVEKGYEFVLRCKNEGRSTSTDTGEVAKSDDSVSFSDENPEYTTYEDTNAMNSLMRNFYMKPNSRPGSRPGSQPGSGNSTPIGGRSPYRPSDADIAPTPLFTIDRTGTKKMPYLQTKQSLGSPKPKECPQRVGNCKTASSTNMDVVIELSNDDDLTQREGLEKDVSSKTWSAADGAKDPSFSAVVEDKSSHKSKEGLRPAKKRRKHEIEPDEFKKKTPDMTQSNITFADVGGNDKVLVDVCRLLVHLKHPEVYRQLGVTPPQGFLLHGPPGCGKTLMAHAIAGELELPFLKVAATEIVSGVSGESEEKVRDIFQKAMANAPCVLFIDEIDSITQKRENASKDMERRIVSQLLTCMDELNSADAAHVLVIGATNRPDSLDPALRRAGRFDREISLGIPDSGARERILRVICRGLRLHQDLDLASLASLTPGFVGADLMALAREAAITAVNRVFKSLQCDSNAEDVSDVKGTCDADATMADGDNQTRDVCLEKDSLDSSDGKINDIQQPTTYSVQKSEVVDLKSDSFARTDNPESTSQERKPEETISTELNVIELERAEENNGSASSNKDIENKVLEKGGEKSFVDGLGKSITHSIVDETDLATVLGWLKDQPPLSENQLTNLWIEKGDFESAVQHVQPSAKREGFATIPDVTWSDIGALKDIREELQMAILAPVRHPEQFLALGLTSAPGILLAGPPGCGKTLLAKAVANESGINFISVKGPELLNMYVGESERAVRQVFQRARNSSPCVIFFDELDALCPKRSGSGEGGSSVRVVNQLLTEMDGLEERKQVFIMAATNRPDIIDPAILRPGRLDKTLYVGLPTVADRFDILMTITQHGTRPKLTDDVDLEAIAAHPQCEGYTGADLAALVRESAVTALREFMSDALKCNEDVVVSLRHFETAFSKVKPSVTENDKKKYENMRTRLQP